MDIRSLRSEADEVRANITELVSKAGELTDSQVGDLEAAEVRLLELNKEINKAEIVERATKAIDVPTFTRRGSAAVETTTSVDPYEQTARNMIAHARGEFRAYNTTDDSSLVPTDLQDELVRRLPKLSAVRAAANVRVFNSNALIPSIAGRMASATLVAESAASQALEGTYTDIEIKAFSTRAKSVITLEMLQDNRGGLVADTLQQHIESHAEGWDALYLSTQTPATHTQPNGLCATKAAIDGNTNSPINDVDAAATVTAAGIDIDNLIDTMNALPGRYRTGDKSWIMSPAVHAAVVSSTDSTSRLVFLPAATGTVQENPLAVGTILGYPVYLSDNMPSAANNAVAAILLDRRSYTVADRRGFETSQDPYSAADNGQVVFRSFMRSDGVWMLPEASSRLIYAT